MRNQPLLLMSKNKILREEIIGILKNNSIDNNTSYGLLSILKYNIVLEPDEIKNYLIDNNTNSYLSVIKNIDTIIFDKSISMFHDLNDLIFVFYEKSKELVKKNLNNTTKKIYLRCLNTKKTLKKRYRD
jgi:hypothetical protein